MSSTASNRLRIELQATGENRNTWGTKLNDSALVLLEEAIAGVEEISVSGVSGTQTLTASNFASDQARNVVLRFTGAASNNLTWIAPAKEKFYFVQNATTGGYSMTIKTQGGSGVTITAGNMAFVFCDGTNFYKADFSTSSSQTADLFLGTALTSVTVEAGTKSFTLQESGTRAWGAGATVLRGVAVSDPTTYIQGYIESYAHPSVAINVSAAGFGGSGVVSNWRFAPAGASWVITESFTGGAQAIVSTANVTLGTDSKRVISANVSLEGGTLRMPSATSVLQSGGPIRVISNDGVFPLGIEDASGTLINVLLPGELSEAYLVSVSSTAGDWRFSHRNSLLAGPQFTFGVTGMDTIAMCTIGASTIFAAYLTSGGGSVMGVILEVSGMRVSVGTAATVSASAAGFKDVNVARLDANKPLIVYMNNSDLIAVAASCSGAVIGNYGAPIVVATSVSAINACRIDTNKAFITYARASAGGDLLGQINIIGCDSGVSVSAGASAVLVSATALAGATFLPIAINTSTVLAVNVSHGLCNVIEVSAMAASVAATIAFTRFAGGESQLVAFKSSAVGLMTNAAPGNGTGFLAMIPITVSNENADVGNPVHIYPTSVGPHADINMEDGSILTVGFVNNGSTIQGAVVSNAQGNIRSTNVAKIDNIYFTSVSSIVGAKVDTNKAVIVFNHTKTSIGGLNVAGGRVIRIVS